MSLTRLEALRAEMRTLEQDLRAARAAECDALPDPLDVVVLHAAGRGLAVPAVAVAEVVPRVLLAEAPAAPRWLAGFMQYRGTSLPVVDLGALWSGMWSPVRLDQQIALLTTGGARRGLLVDRAEAVETVSRAALAPVPPEVAGGEWCTAVLRSRERAVLLLSLDALRDLALP